MGKSTGMAGSTGVGMGKSTGMAGPTGVGMGAVMMSVVSAFPMPKVDNRLVDKLANIPPMPPKSPPPVSGVAANVRRRRRGRCQRPIDARFVVTAAKESDGRLDGANQVRGQLPSMPAFDHARQRCHQCTRSPSSRCTSFFHGFIGPYPRGCSNKISQCIKDVTDRVRSRCIDGVTRNALRPSRASLQVNHALNLVGVDTPPEAGKAIRASTNH